MNVTGSIVNKNTMTIFAAAFVATLMAVFTAAAVMPQNDNVLAHSQQPVKTASAESEFGSCTDPSGSSKTTVKKAGSTNTVVNKTINKTRTIKTGVNVDATVKDVVDVNVEDVVDVNDVVDINDNYVPIISHNSVLNNVLSGNSVDVGLDSVVGLLN